MFFATHHLSEFGSWVVRHGRTLLKQKRLMAFLSPIISSINASGVIGTINPLGAVVFFATPINVCVSEGNSISKLIW